jgi:hypothetical protein
MSGSTTSRSAASASAANSDPLDLVKDLVFTAVIEVIECAPLGARGRFLDWVVRTRVEQVIEGDFTGNAFVFRVHSPARSGLELGRRCTVRAIAVEGGYTVDENQWSGAPHDG